MSKRIDLTGKRFNNLLVESIAYTKNRNTYFNCICNCGNRCVVRHDSLTRNHTKSCGCLKKGRFEVTHGKSCTKEYRAWINLKKRCYYKNDNTYKHYGGRGIVACQGIRNDFLCFYNTVGSAPSKNHSIDRIETNRNYSCGKCSECLENGWSMNIRWATKKQQVRNMRSNCNIVWNGESKCIAAWAKELGILSKTLRRRLDTGWSIEKAFTTPIGKRSKHNQ